MDYNDLPENPRERVLAIRRMLAEHKGFFPNAGNLGQFCYRSQTIQLHRTRANEFRQAIEDRNFAAIREDLEVIFHEITHWADTIGTLWGQRHLRYVFSAYEVVLNNYPEQTYERVVALHDAERRLRYPDYYRFVHNTPTRATVETPWRIAWTVGHEFDAYGRINRQHPIIFVRLSDHGTGEEAIRQPLTVGSLLETSAMWSEMRTGLEAFALLDPIQAAIDKRLHSEKMKEYLYNPNVTEYTAPAHMLSVLCQIGEVYSTYEHAAMLIQIALNLPQKYVCKLSVSGAPPSVLTALRNRGEPGFIFAALCEAAPKSSPDADVSEWVENVLTACGLPCREKILGEAKAELSNVYNAMKKKKTFPLVEHLYDVGISILAARSSERDPSVTLYMAEKTGITLPPMFDSEGEILLLTDRCPDFNILDPHEMYDAEAKLHTWLINFLAACR